MDPKAIRKAAKRLREARAHLVELRSLQTSPLAEAFEQEWYRFLVTVHSVPESLRTGARGNPRSRQWINAQYKVIRADPMLQYLLQSRAADFHGTKRLTELKMSNGASYIDPEIDPLSDTHETERGTFHVPDSITRLSLWYELQPAVDEMHGDTYPVPTEHLGQQLSVTTPTAIAEKAITFYADLLRQAAERPWAADKTA